MKDRELIALMSAVIYTCEHVETVDDAIEVAELMLSKIIPNADEK